MDVWVHGKIAGVGLLSAKKILTFTKAFIKRRRGDTEGSVIAASTAAGEEKDEKSDVDKEASEAAVHAQVADEVCDLPLGWNDYLGFFLHSYWYNHEHTRSAVLLENALRWSCRLQS